MNIRELRNKLSETQSEFSIRYKIPVRTIQNLENGVRLPPEFQEQFTKLSQEAIDYYCY